jgi:DNA-binding transcriptional LysR family regulator
MRLGVTELIACTWLQVFLRACREAYPAVKVELRVDLGREIDRELAAGELDLALQTGPFSDAADCVQPLGRHRYAWVARPEVARALGPAPDYAAIFDRTVLTHARHTEAAAALDRFSRDRGLAVEQIVHSSSLASCLPMAVDGVGVALLPKALVAEALAARQLAMLECDWLPDPLEDFARYDSARAAGFIGQAAEMAVRVAREAAEYQEN